MEYALKERYVYYRDANRLPLVTIAMLRTTEGVVSYGWSICSPTDMPRYGQMRVYRDMPHARHEWWVSGGKPLAYGRALAALSRGVQISDGVWRYARDVARPEALRVIEACQANGLLALVWHNTTAALPKSMQPWETQG